MSATQVFTSSRRLTPSDMRARNSSSEHFVVSDLYRVTVPRLYRTLYTHSGPYRLWAVLPAHDFPARRMAVSEGAIMQHPVYRLRRIPLPRTPVNRRRM
jgi:hypothetical protein